VANACGPLGPDDPNAAIDPVMFGARWHDPAIAVLVVACFGG